ncbi:MAG: SDR family NAD(P)-dependent oxidoreductase [Chloroflexia bacterium]|nr:SDR family NAD(P)-dependent oxidoreductase [Chloroflexia bacterium]
MMLQNNTILITGGSSGIGLELAKKLSKSNKVIICGRSKEKLEQAKNKLPEISIYQCDLSKQGECEGLAAWIKEHYPQCNILINNAALVNVTQFYSDEKAIEKADFEMRTNFMAPIILSKLLIPVLERNTNSKLINVTTGLVYAPKAAYPFYNATKAALHSFTQVLRIQMEKVSKLSIVEVMFPAVDTPWHNGNAPKIAIPVESAVNEMLEKLGNGEIEIKIAKVNLIYKM